jgi:uncharacterized protein YdhG (YjbR/CyaY superfamily)
MLSGLQTFYENQPEPNQSCFFAIRQFVLKLHPDFTEEYKYGLPFFYFQGKGLCYSWYDKKTSEPYIGFADGKLLDHPRLELGDRKRMKIFRIDPSSDLPIEDLKQIIEDSISLRLKAKQTKK